MPPHREGPRSRSLHGRAVCGAGCVHASLRELYSGMANLQHLRASFLIRWGCKREPCLPWSGQGLSSPTISKMLVTMPGTPGSLLLPLWTFQDEGLIRGQKELALIQTQGPVVGEHSPHPPLVSWDFLSTCLLQNPIGFVKLTFWAAFLFHFLGQGYQDCVIFLSAWFPAL